MNLYQHVDALKAWAAGDIRWSLDAVGQNELARQTGVCPMSLRRAANQTARLEKIVEIHEKVMRAVRGRAQR